MSDIFREIEEEIRHDRFKNLWDRYKIYVISFVVLVIASVSAVKFWQNYELSKQQFSGDKFSSVLDMVDNKQYDKATSALEFMKPEVTKIYQNFSDIMLTGINHKKEDNSAVVQRYKDILESLDDDKLANIIRLKIAFLQIDSASYDDVKSTVEPLNSGVWAILYNEVLGVSAYKNGDIEQAKMHLDSVITDDNISQTTLERIKKIRALL